MGAVQAKKQGNESEQITHPSHRSYQKHGQEDEMTPLGIDADHAHGEENLTSDSFDCGELGPKSRKTYRYSHSTEKTRCLKSSDVSPMKSPNTGEVSELQLSPTPVPNAALPALNIDE